LFNQLPDVVTNNCDAVFEFRERKRTTVAHDVFPRSSPDKRIGGRHYHGAIGVAARLILLRQHPILGPEVMSSVGDELPVAWMIDGFDSDDDPHQLGIMLADVLDQLGLGVGRAGDENRVGFGEGFRDGMKIFMIRGGVPAADRIGLVMDVLGRMLRTDDEPFDIGPAEMKNARLSMVDPDDGVVMMGGHVLNPRR